MNKYKVPSVAEIKENLATNGYKFEVVSLFAGGGGSSTGYRMAGGHVLAINEFVESAQETYHANWDKTYIFKSDIRQLTGTEILKQINKKSGELDILDGSPPCCAFSTCGKRDKGWGETHKYSDVSQGNIEDLFFEYLRILKDLQPKCCVAENVKGLVIGSAKGYFNLIKKGFEEAGYVVTAKVLNAAYLGVPQSRERLIFVGVRKDLWRDEFKGLTHPKPFNYVFSAGEALEDITLTEEEKKYTDISKYSVYKSLVKLKKGGEDFNLKKVDPAKPSRTITATTGNIGAKNPCHWNNRAFCVREIKRLCSVPDDYILKGTIQQQIERCGRMVPPLMMKAIADNLYTNILSRL